MIKIKLQDNWNDVIRNIESEVRRSFTTEQMQNVVEAIGMLATQYVPVDTGNLRDSQYKNVRIDGTKLIGTVGYDLSRAPYAIIVHETPREYKKPGSKWKFLEDAAFQVYSVLEEYR